MIFVEIAKTLSFEDINTLLSITPFTDILLLRDKKVISIT